MEKLNGFENYIMQKIFWYPFIVNINKKEKRE